MIRHKKTIRSTGGIVSRGFTLIEVLAALAVIGLLMALLVPAVQSSRAAARRVACTSNLRQLALAVERFVGVRGEYPSHRHYTSDGEPRANPSIHISLLPYLDQQALFDKLDHKGWTNAEPPSAPTNHFAISQPVPVFKCPADSVPTGGNSYRGCYGTTPGIHGTWLPGTPKTDHSLWGVLVHGYRPGHLRDGASQTVMFSERIVGDGRPDRHDPVRDVVHTPHYNLYPNDAVINCAAVFSGDPHLSFSGWTWLSNSYAHTAYNHCLPPNAQIPDCLNGWSATVVGPGAMAARSWHPGGVNAAFADGAVKFINESIDLQFWRALATLDGEEIIDGF